MQMEQPNLKSTKLGADVNVILLRTGGYSIKAEVKMGVTCQLLWQSPWYSLCPTTSTGIIPIIEGGGPQAQAPACSQQALGNPLGVILKNRVII
uniref:Uncharacterized protein n=1 Tax=Romanomermis culicivorax TaxID=13658 RepID=A0A915JCI4_ROMCU